MVVIIGLWIGKGWARIAYIILFPSIAGLEVLADPGFHTAVRLAILIVLCVSLFRPKASAYFRGEALPPIDPATGLDAVDHEIISCPSCGKEIYSSVVRCHNCGVDLSIAGTLAPAE